MRGRNYSSSVLPEGKLLSENTRVRITFSKIQPRPRLYDLTKLGPIGNEEPL